VIRVTLGQLAPRVTQDYKAPRVTPGRKDLRAFPGRLVPLEPKVIQETKGRRE
jgi:hypothetical protein